MRFRTNCRPRQPKTGPNKTEEAYGYHIANHPDVLMVGFERIKLKLADKTFYTPDFYVLKKDGQLEMHEVKGFMRDDAAVKLKVAAAQFPFIKFFLIKKDKTGWDIREVENVY